MYKEEKRRLLEQFYQYTLELEKQLLKEEALGLADLLNKREELIQGIGELDANQPENTVKQTKLELSDLLGCMIQKEAHVKLLMQQKKDQLSEELQKLQVSKKANQAYQKKGFSFDGSFIDTKSHF